MRFLSNKFFMDFKFGDITEKIIGAAMRIHGILG